MVAVDVNSGRATKEHDIEETALRTNLETCDELARQLRLRDMAGLIVIDFIDMEEAKNNAAVERRLKEALKKDRARIQAGKMSGFGLVEMSRQRLHSSFLESSYQPCIHCAGKGVVRSVESCAMHALHVLEEAAFKNNKNKILISLPLNVATYLLNVKRTHLVSLETRYNVNIQIIPDDSLLRSSDFKLERIREDGERQNINLHAQQKQEQKEKKKQEFFKNQPEKKQEKVEKQPVTAPVETKEPVEAAPQEEAPQNEKKLKNKRRHEWRKRRREKRMLSRLKQQEENMSQQETPASTGEEKFTVVEQKDFSDFNKKENEKSTQQTADKEEKDPVKEKKQQQKRRGGKRPNGDKNQKAEKQQTTPSAESKEKNIVVPKKKEPQETILPSKETVSTPQEVSSQERKKGWWNKLVS